MLLEQIGHSNIKSKQSNNNPTETIQKLKQ